MNAITELYGIKKKYYKKLKKKYTDEQLLKQYKHFQVGDKLHQITGWFLTYYIDKHGDFTEKRGCNHDIARAIMKSLKPAEQLELYQYIEEHENGEHI